MTEEIGKKRTENVSRGKTVTIPTERDLETFANIERGEKMS